MTSMDDTWTLSDLSSSSRGGSLRNSLVSSSSEHHVVNNVNNKNRQQQHKNLQKPTLIYSPMSSIDSQSGSESDGVQNRPIKPFLKRTSGGYKAANPMVDNILPNYTDVNMTDNTSTTKPQSKSPLPTPNIIPLPSKPEMNLVEHNKPPATNSVTSSQNNQMITRGFLNHIPPQNRENLISSHHLRGYEIAPPKINTHIDFMEYMKVQNRRKEFEIRTDAPTTKVEEEKKEMKIPEALYTYIAKSSPQKKEPIVNDEIKKENRVKFPKPAAASENPKQKPDNPKQESPQVTTTTRKISGIVGRKFDNDGESAPASIRIEKPAAINIEKPKAQQQPPINVNINKNNNNYNKDEEQLEKVGIRKMEKEYDEILSKTANQFSNTINNSLNHMGLEVKNFYKQLDKLQKVSADVTSKFGKQLNQDQQRSQSMLLKQMQQIQDLGKKMGAVEEKVAQLREDSEKAANSSRTFSKTNSTTSTPPVRSKKVYGLMSGKPTTADLVTIDHVHNEVSKKHPSIFKYPNHLEVGSVVVEQPNFAISLDEKVKIDNIPPRPLIISKVELSGDEIKKNYPEFSKNLLKFSIAHNKPPNKPTIVATTTTTIDENIPPPPVLIMETHSVQTNTKNVSVNEVEIQTELLPMNETTTTTESDNTSIPNTSEDIEKYNSGWSKKDNSAMNFQNGIDVTVEKELSRFEKERLIKEMLPKKAVQVPKINEEEFDGICFTSHYPNRSVKTDEKTQKRMSTYTKGEKDLDLIFEEYANCLIERVIRHISTNLIGEYLNGVFCQEDAENVDISEEEKFKTIKGGALCAELFSYCITNGIPFDDELVYNATESVLLEYIKSKIPHFDRHDSVTELGEMSSEECDLGRVSELVLRMLLLSRLGSWKKESEDVEFVSHKLGSQNNNNFKEKDTPTPKKTSETIIIPKYEPISVGTIETQTEQQIPEIDKVSPTTDTQPRLGLPHSTFFILSDNFPAESSIPISTEPVIQQFTTFTQTIQDEPATTRVQSSSVQTTELKTSISSVQTEAPTTNAKNLVVQFNPFSQFNIAPQIAPQKDTQSRDIQTSFTITGSKPVTTKKPSVATSSTDESVSSTITSSSSQISTDDDPTKNYSYIHQQQDGIPVLQRDKVFATLTENDIERMLKLQMLKRSVMGRNQLNDTMHSSSDFSESEDSTSFLSSEKSMSTFYTSDSSNGFSYKQKRFDSDLDYFNSSSSYGGGDDDHPYGIGTSVENSFSNTSLSYTDNYSATLRSYSTESSNE